MGPQWCTRCDQGTSRQFLLERVSFAIELIFCKSQILHIVATPNPGHAQDPDQSSQQEMLAEIKLETQLQMIRGRIRPLYHTIRGRLIAMIRISTLSPPQTHLNNNQQKTNSLKRLKNTTQLFLSMILLLKQLPLAFVLAQTRKTFVNCAKKPLEK